MAIGMRFQMAKNERKVRKENGDELRVFKLFAEYERSHVIETNWLDIDNPVYLELSKRSGKSKNVIRDIICKMQPSLNSRKYRYMEKVQAICFKCNRLCSLFV